MCFFQTSLQVHVYKKYIYCCADTCNNTEQVVARAKRAQLASTSAF